MKLSLYNIGKTDIAYIQEGIDEYTRRLGHFSDFTVNDIPVKKLSWKESPETLCAREGELILKAVEDSNYIVLLDEKGKEFNSRELAQWLEKLQHQGLKKIAFVTGGAYGFSDQVYQAADFRLSLSRMTLTHQMVRLFFTEQLYRAHTIMKGIPYHND